MRRALYRMAPKTRAGFVAEGIFGLAAIVVVVVVLLVAATAECVNCGGL